MDFIMGVSHTSQGYNSIWVIIDRLTKFAHFLLVQMPNNAEKLAWVYVYEIVHSYGVPVSIISNRSLQFTSNFGRYF